MLRRGSDRGRNGNDAGWDGVRKDVTVTSRLTGGMELIRSKEGDSIHKLLHRHQRADGWDGVKKGTAYINYITVTNGLTGGMVLRLSLIHI